MYNTLPAVKKVSDCPLTLSESVPKKGLSVEALESRRTNIGVTRINVLYTTYCILVSASLRSDIKSFIKDKEWDLKL